MSSLREMNNSQLLTIGELHGGVEKYRSSCVCESVELKRKIKFGFSIQSGKGRIVVFKSQKLTVPLYMVISTAYANGVYIDYF